MTTVETTESRLHNRPAYHVTAKRNWINDPCAPMYWNGNYHVFYQHNPHGTVWGEMHWGHSVSRDLVHWEDMEIAMSPSAEGPDSGGCWSGCGRVIDGVPTMFYTGVTEESGWHAENVCVATGSDALEILVRDRANPIIPAVSPESPLRNYRDPFLVRFDDRWLMLLGTGLRVPKGEAGAGAVVVFESFDLKAWDFNGVVFSQPAATEPIDTGPVWECPQLARFGDDWVLIVSAQRPQPALCYTVWFIGSFDGKNFVPRATGMLDHGDVLYAPALFEAPDGRTLMAAWLQETDANAASRRGRAGAHSIPRTVAVVNDRVATRPVRELDECWTPVTVLERVDLGNGGPVQRLGDVGSAYRLTFTVDIFEGRAGARLLSTVNAEECAVYVERSNAGAGHLQLLVVTPGAVSPLTAALPSDLAEVSVDVYVDDTIVEIFVGTHAALTTRMYPNDDDACSVDLVALDARARFVSVELSEFSARGRN